MGTQRTCGQELPDQGRLLGKHSMNAASLPFVNTVANNCQLRFGLSTSLITLSHKGDRKGARVRPLGRTNRNPPPSAFLMDMRKGLY